MDPASDSDVVFSGVQFALDPIKHLPEAVGTLLTFSRLAGLEIHPSLVGAVEFNRDGVGADRQHTLSLGPNNNASPYPPDAKTICWP